MKSLFRTRYLWSMVDIDLNSILNAGGPLVNMERNLLIGIVSFGSVNCGRSIFKNYFFVPLKPSV